MEKRISVPRTSSIYKLNMTSMVWNISIGQLGLPAWLSSLLVPASTEYTRLEKALDFLATTKSIHIINVLLLPNPKHSGYWEEN